MANSTDLYSYQGQEPQLLPDEIGWDDGIYQSRTGVESFTKEDLKKAGYTGPYVFPEYDQEYQRVHWDSKKLKYVVEDISDEELWDRVRAERNRLLSACDWVFAADASNDLNFREWEMYRQRLRDITNLYEHPKDIIWPSSPEGVPDDNFDQPRVYEEKIIWRIRDLELAVKKIREELRSQSVDTAPTEV